MAARCRTTMPAAEYFLTCFQEDLDSFLESVRANGSASMAVSLSAKEYRAFSYVDLTPLKLDGRATRDHLRHVKKANRPMFLQSIFFACLMNQLFHNHFREIHPAFARKVRFPIVYGFLASGMYILSPHMVLDGEVLESRGLHEEDIRKDFNLSALWTNLQVICAQPSDSFQCDWEAVRGTIASDNDALQGPLGDALLRFATEPEPRE